MRTQFFYTRRETVANGAPTRPNEQPIYRYFKDSFNLDKVVRSIEMPNGEMLVLLNDIHERTTETPNINPRNNKMSGITRKRDTFQSEIYLSKEDGERFYRVTAIEYVTEYQSPSPMDEVIEKITHNGDQETTGA